MIFLFIISYSTVICFSSRHLANVWNVNVCVSLLLLCGRLKEASELSSEVGSWKTAISVGAVLGKVRALKDDKEVACMELLFKNRFCDLIPFSLHHCGDENVCNHQKNEFLFQWQPESSAVHFIDIFVAGVMIGCDIAMWGAAQMLILLKDYCHCLSFLEPDDLYLPAPPLFLPQPTPDCDKSERIYGKHIIDYTV